jgi:hypothetical protein
MINAAAGSAHHQPATAFRRRPTRRATDGYAQTMFRRALFNRCRTVELITDAALRAGEKRHRRSGYGRKSATNPARLRMVASDQRPNGLDADVRGQDEEADRDHLLRSSIRGWRLQASPGEEHTTMNPGGAAGHSISHVL